MKILITAGATEVPIDRVRILSNVFSGKTGVDIAQRAETISRRRWIQGLPEEQWMQTRVLQSRLAVLTHDLEDEGTEEGYHSRPLRRCSTFRTFDELAKQMECEVRSGPYDAIIHSAAVSDYRVVGAWTGDPIRRLEPVGIDAKIGSDHARLFLELAPTVKLVDQIRKPWGFRGVLVKFKLQVGMSDEELLAIARKSMETSDADLIVANCLEWARERAYILDRRGGCESLARDKLAETLLDKVEVAIMEGRSA